MTDGEPMDPLDHLAEELADQAQQEAIDYLVQWASDIRVRFVNHGWSTDGAEAAAQAILQAQLDRQMMGVVVTEEEDVD